MDELRGFDIPQNRLDLARRAPGNSARIGRTVVDQPAGDFTPARIDTSHDVAAYKLAHHLRDAHGQQALVLIAQRADRTRVKHQAALELQMTCHPLFAGGKPGKFRNQLGSDGLACDQTHKDVVLTARTDHGACTAQGSPLRRKDLGEHAPLTDPRSRATSHRRHGRVTGNAPLNQSCAGMMSRIGGKKPRLIGQNHQ